MMMYPVLLPNGYEPSLTEVMVGGVVFFGAIYFGFALLNLLLQKGLRALGIGRVLDPRPLRPQQIWREIGWSSLSILLFGTGMVFPWMVLKLGWSHAVMDAGIPRILLEMLALLLWNEVHFYLNHRLLHTRWMLPRFHVQHHRSHVTTPFSTYAFHPVEALLLGNVLLLPMIVHDFSWQAMLSLPLLSLLLNNIGHANYDLFPAQGGRSWLTSSRRHHLHHACSRGNFGFLLPFMDQLFHTDLPDDAADRVLQAHQSRHAA